MNQTFPLFAYKKAPCLIISYCHAAGEMQHIFLQPFLNPHKDAQNVTKLRKSLIKIKFPSRVFYWHLVRIELTTGCHAVFSQSQLPGFLISCLVFQVKGCHISRTCDEFTQAILVWPALFWIFPLNKWSNCICCILIFSKTELLKSNFTELLQC